MPDVLERWRRQRMPPGFIEEIDVLEEWRAQRVLVEEPAAEPTWWERGWELEGIKTVPEQYGRAWMQVGMTMGKGATWLARFCPGQKNLPDWEEQGEARKALTAGQGVSALILAGLIGYTGATAIASLAKLLVYGRTDKIAAKFAVQHFDKIKAQNPQVKTLEDAQALAQASLRSAVAPKAEVTYLPTTMKELGRLGKILLRPLPKATSTAAFKTNLIEQTNILLTQAGVKPTTETMKPFLETIEHYVGVPATGMVAPEFGKAVIAEINEFIPAMIDAVKETGRAYLPFERPEIIPEEEIVEREIKRPLVPLEEYAPPEVIPKVEIPKEVVPEEIKPEVEVVKPPIPPTEPPAETPGFGEEPEPKIDPIAKLNELIKAAKPLRQKLEKAYTAERAKRIGEVEKFIDETIDKVGGEEGYKMILSKLKGELAPPEMKITFEPIKEKLTYEELKTLYVRTWKHPYLANWEKVSAAEGLTNLLMGGIPQPKKLVLLEEIYGSELIKNILSKRVWGAKATDFLIELGNIPRAALATADMSAFLRQGIIPVIAHPEISAKAAAKTFQFAFKPATFEQYFKDLPEHRHYKLIRQFKVAITDPSRASMVEREEAFISQFLQKIPIIKIPVKFAERAYVGFLNKVRVDLFSLWADELLSKGLVPTKNPEEFRAAADVVNNFTGRGTLPAKLDRITPQLNTIFFSPRLIAARFNALNPVWYAKQPKEIRKKAIGDFAKFVAAGLTTLALVKLAAGDKVDIEIDPRSSDFGKIRIGNTRWDIWGGFQQWVRVFTQIIMGERKSTITGEIISLNKDEYPFTTRKEVLLRFMEGKLAPVPQLVNELVSGAKTFGGEDITADYIVKSKFIPMYIQDITEAYEDGGLGRATGAGVPAFFGVGVQTWKPRKRPVTAWWR